MYILVDIAWDGKGRCNPWISSHWHSVRQIRRFAGINRTKR